MAATRPTLFVLIGPTAVGKTELSLRMAEFLRCPILNADSRQLYRDLPIGTAAPTAEQLARVPHHPAKPPEKPPAPAAETPAAPAAE